MPTEVSAKGAVDEPPEFRSDSTSNCDAPREPEPNWASLEGHVSVVTGGNAGIGLGLARGLAQAGASVAILGRRPDRNAAAIEELTADIAGARLRAYTCDVSDEEALSTAIVAIANEFGRLDSCFANAGISGTSGHILATSTTEWRDIMNINLEGAFHTARVAAELMKQQNHGGSIVFTSSLSAFDAAPVHAPYAASKAALLSLTRSLAAAVARDGIRVNAIVPGWVDTDMTAEALSDSTVREIIRRIPLRRMGTAADLEALAVLLAGSGSAYLTGQAIVVDGGYSIF